MSAISEIYDKYKIGGLEPSGDGTKTLVIDGVSYVVNDKFKSMIRDSFIDWGSFLEIYNDNMDCALMFNQITKLLDIKENENLRDVMIPLLEKIYNLPAGSHLACMMRQFMVYEPLSAAIHDLFLTIKTHYENILITFLDMRNNHIQKNNLSDKPNNIAMLKKYWEEMDQQYGLESSSTVLLFLNPPQGMKSKLNFNISGLETYITELRAGVKKFHYQGFCPKVAPKRLNALLEFPLKEFVRVMKKMEPDAKFPDYNKLESIMKEELSRMPTKPRVIDTIVRKPPIVTTDKLTLAKWYVEEILNIRKNLLKYGNAYEEYYTEQASIFITINRKIKKELM